MFAFLKAKPHGMLRSFGLHISNKLPPMRDPTGSSTRPKARDCHAIARRWDALARQADTAEQRMLRQQIANGWRDLAGGW